VSSASDAPVRQAGTRTRSGNTMAHTRAALLHATDACVARYGVRKTTMVDVASRSGVAKATLYNHFRTKDDVLVALVEQRVTELVASALAADGLQAALEGAAHTIATAAALRKVATDEPGYLAPLLRPSDARAWTVAREGIAAVLTKARVPAGQPQVETVLRWFTSQLMWPSAEGAAGLIEGLGAPVAVRQPVQETRAADEPVAGVGWPAGMAVSST
jgi:AcrR family transcriptional regulator